MEIQYDKYKYLYVGTVLFLLPPKSLTTQSVSLRYPFIHINNHIS